MLRRLAIMGLICIGAMAAKADVATIVNSGSTNRAGFRIAIDDAGVAEFTATPRRLRAPEEQAKPLRQVLPAATAKRFRADLEAAKPFDALPKVHCAKSASFGSRLTVEFDGEETPDLGCGAGGSDTMRNLILDVREISGLFQVH
ncbi:MAG: hypothetical protein ABSB15_19975 [Bryobacteraceae bacterium]|jgi:hypothetical protein